jgi:hypothetical protein
MKPQDRVETFVKSAAIDTGPAANERVLGRMREAYSKAAEPCSLGLWRRVLEHRFVRVGAAAVVFLALAVGVGHFGGILGAGSVAWAEVTQRFQSVQSFYASIYIRRDALAQPQHFELWMGRGGRARMRVDEQVIFGQTGRVTRAFDIRRRRQTEVNKGAADILAILGSPDEFSLETVIRSISAGKLVDVTPTVNTQAGIGEDLVVFDGQSAVSPGSMRVYALRQSKLPVGLRIWDSAEGFLVDALITYGKEQPAIAFDPEAFAARLSEPGVPSPGLAYLFLKDPGDRDMTPQALSR